MVNEDETNYDVLGVASNASKDEIRDAYREQLSEAQAGVTREETAKRPSGSSIAAARAEEARIRAAWQVLSDPMQRARYDTAHGIDNTGTEVELADDDGDGDDDQGDDGQDSTPVSRRPARSLPKLMTAQLRNPNEIALRRPVGAHAKVIEIERGRPLRPHKLLSYTQQVVPRLWV